MSNYKQKEDASMAEYVFGRTMPQALELEEAVLGAIMLDKDALPSVIDILKPDSFYSNKNAAVFNAMLTLFGRGDAIDILTVSEQIRKDGNIDTIGGSYYLAELTNRVASAANLEYHARIVAERSMLRRIIQESTNAIQDAYDPSADAFDLLHRQQANLFSLSNLSGRMAEGVGRIGIDVLKRAEAAMQIPDGITGVPCGLEAIDKTTGGWQPTDFIVLAARPGMGKTAFVLCNALHAAKQGIPVALFSLEMGREQLVQRIISLLTGIPAKRIKRGMITEDEVRQIGKSVNEMADLPLYIDDTPGINIFELRAKCRRMQMQHGIQMVIVDYLQLMSGEKDRNSTREQEVSSISRGCKHLAKELNVPVIALSQLSRAVEIRGGSKRPQLSDLRESGSLEQDADLVGFLYRPEYYNILEDEQGNSLKGVAEFLIEKHRHGALDDIGLSFDGPTTKFSDLSKINNQPISTQPTPAPAYTMPRNEPEDDIPF